MEIGTTLPVNSSWRSFIICAVISVTLTCVYLLTEGPKAHVQNLVSYISDKTEARESDRLASQYHIPREERYLTFKHNKGRLGNQLFLYCATVGLAAKNNMTFVYPSPEELRAGIPFYVQTVFRVDLRHRTDVSPYNDVKYDVLNHTKHVGHVNLELYIDWPISGQAVTLSGFPHYYKYFADIEDRLRNDLQFHDPFVRKSTEFYHNISNYVTEVTNTSYTWVGVHIRRSEFLAANLQEAGYTAASETFFKNAAEYYINKYGHILFVVSTQVDTIPWAEHVFSSIESSHTGNVRVVYTEGINPGVDLAIITRCEHSIVSTGTYSWWSGWITGGEVVYYKNWPRKGSMEETRFNSSEYFPPKWIPL